jgi:hypothetical protein
MTRSTVLITAILSAILITGCDKAIDDQAKANNAQTAANEKIAAANQEANQKAQAAQAEADKKIAEATANFTKMREDYRDQTTKNLVDLDHRVDALDAASRSPSSKNRSALETNLKLIHTKRAEFTSDYLAIETASAVTWDDTKTRLDKELSELKALVDATA